MTDEQQVIAEGLRNLHLPPPIGAWPPAPGWWALCGVLLGVLAYVLWQVVKRRQRSDPKRLALAALSATFDQWQNHGDQASYLQQSHSILKRLAISLAGRTCVSRLSGEPWVDWLEQQREQQFHQPFSPAVRVALAYGAYQKTSTLPIEQLHTAYVNWVRNCRLQTPSHSVTRQEIIATQSQSSVYHSPATAMRAKSPNA